VVVLLARVVESGRRTVLEAVLELLAYVIVTGVFTWFSERDLIREAVRYGLSGRRGVPG
jgi:hypothetical protein